MKFKNLNKITGLVLVLSLITIMLASCVYSATDIVKEGTPNDYPNQTWGETLDIVCRDGKWIEFETDDGDTMVQFDGTIKATDVALCMQFKVDCDENTFIVDYVDVDGEELDLISTTALIRTLFEGI